MIHVYDSSFVSALVIPDDKIISVEKNHIRIAKSGEIFTTPLFNYEIANIFRNLVRRKRYTSNEVVQFFPFISAIGLKIDFEEGVNYQRRIWNLSNDYNLSTYDAAYLELADRKKAVLCTLDNNLKNAAKTHGIKIID
ncbi:MAG: type II toxin-antitoxin system VapC family toxin [Treponema sp.]|nr:type II toxin-antitoxin system VapC family toxin [Treponema sp.]